MKTMIPAVPATLAFAKGLFTRGTDAFGAEEIAKVFGVVPAHIPPVPFSEAELTRARELGQYLILQVNAVPSNNRPITMKCIYEQFNNKLGDGKLLWKVDWYPSEAFYTTDTPRPGWALVSREVIPGSLSKDYIGQTQVICDYLANEVYRGEELPVAYQAAVDEFNARKSKLEELRDHGNNWQRLAEELAGLKLNILFREKSVEVIYGLVVQHEVNRERLLKKTYAWTNQRSSDGDLVLVGYCDSGGVRVSDGELDFSDSDLGVRFFRSGSSNSAS